MKGNPPGVCFFLVWSAFVFHLPTIVAKPEHKAEHAHPNTRGGNYLKRRHLAREWLAHFGDDDISTGNDNGLDDDDEPVIFEAEEFPDEDSSEDPFPLFEVAPSASLEDPSLEDPFPEMSPSTDEFPAEMPSDEGLPPNFPAEMPSGDEIMTAVPSQLMSPVPTEVAPAPTVGAPAPTVAQDPTSPTPPSAALPTEAPISGPDAPIPPIRPRSCPPQYGCSAINGKPGSQVCYALTQTRTLNACAPEGLVESALEPPTSFCGFCADATPAPTTLEEICNPIISCGPVSILMCIESANITTAGCIRRDKVPLVIDNNAGYCGLCMNVRPPTTVAPAAPIAPSAPGLPSVTPPSPTTSSAPAPTPAQPVVGPLQPTTEPVPGPTGPTTTASPATPLPSLAPISTTVQPTVDPLDVCDPRIECQTLLFASVGNVVCLNVNGTRFSACVGPIFIDAALKIGECGECPTESPSTSPTQEATTVLPTMAPTTLESICDPLIYCRDDLEHVSFCLTDLDLGGFHGDRTICLPIRLLDEALPYGYCGECPDLPTIFPTTDPLENCAPAIECTGIFNLTGIEFCLENPTSGKRATVCCPTRLVQAALAHGRCGVCSPTAAPSVEPTGSPISACPDPIPCECPKPPPPTASPTGPLDGCPVVPPSCAISVGNEMIEGVTFCIVLESGTQVELCVFEEQVQDLLDRGYCGPCVTPPSASPTNLPASSPSALPSPEAAVSPTPTDEPTPRGTSSAPLPSTGPGPTTRPPTLVPTTRPPTPVPTARPTALPTRAPARTIPTNDPSIAPTDDPLSECDPVIPCNDGEGAVFCLTAGNDVEVCMPIDDLQGALDEEAGECGPCPTDMPSLAPTFAPTSSPSSKPSMVPTVDPLGGCPEDPPECSIDPDDAKNRVLFCIVLGGQQQEVCVLVEYIQPLVDQEAGFCGPCPPTSMPSNTPSTPPQILPPIGPSPPITIPPALAPATAPTRSPVLGPSAAPIGGPGQSPSMTPVDAPGATPSLAPVVAAPSGSPALAPTDGPALTPSLAPAVSPTGGPGSAPSLAPMVALPTAGPAFAPSTAPAADPTVTPGPSPSLAPVVAIPSVRPVLAPAGAPAIVTPEASPAVAPVVPPSGNPALGPSVAPVGGPGQPPSMAPVDAPGATPSFAPAVLPTDSFPSLAPVGKVPTVSPVSTPTSGPGSFPSLSPAVTPSVGPGSGPSLAPVVSPTAGPGSTPSSAPVVEAPSGSPALAPTASPVVATPTVSPDPTIVVPTQSPSLSPAIAPMGVPTSVPSLVPTAGELPPECDPVIPCDDIENGVLVCLFQPVELCLPKSLVQAALDAGGDCGPCPTTEPSSGPTGMPTNVPSTNPTKGLTANPTTSPTLQQTGSPNIEPSMAPTVDPLTGSPTGTPSSMPSPSNQILPPFAPFVRPPRPPALDPSAAPIGGPGQSPSMAPVDAPGATPSLAPVVAAPSGSPALAPTDGPALTPSLAPAVSPTGGPGSAPSLAPVVALPTAGPAFAPSTAPAADPTVTPGPSPSLAPVVAIPSVRPVLAPAGAPAIVTPEASPAVAPVVPPSGNPALGPSVAPVGGPGQPPSMAPVDAPGVTPSLAPVIAPTAAPTSTPSLVPTVNPIPPECNPVIPCDDDRAIFCLDIGNLNVELCVLISNLNNLLDINAGNCGPCVSSPTTAPVTTAGPTMPSASPVVSTGLPTATFAPTVSPVATSSPIDGPTQDPASLPTGVPTSVVPSISPVATASPTAGVDTPTGDPASLPTKEPTAGGPTFSPVATASPTAGGTIDRPTEDPASLPTKEPTAGGPTFSPVATASPTAGGTPPEISPTVSPTGEGLSPTTSPTGALECDPVIPCDDDKILFCLQPEGGSGNAEICLPIEDVQEALENGFCGPCPTEAPTKTPTTVPTIPEDCPEDCDCIECTDATYNPDGTKTICVTQTCKDESISWMCCIDVSPSGQCNVDDCRGGEGPDGPKCEEVTEFCMTLDENATSVTIQAHDGQFGGNEDKDPSCGGGGSGSRCPGVTGICSTEVDLSQCPGTRPPTSPPPTTLPPTSEIPSSVPSSRPTIDPLKDCVPIIECTPDDPSYEEGVIMCLESFEGTVCVPDDFVQDALEQGFCGEVCYLFPVALLLGFVQTIPMCFSIIHGALPYYTVVPSIHTANWHPFFIANRSTFFKSTDKCAFFRTIRDTNIDTYYNAAKQ
ncbi:Nidogen-like [Seminavis robusta]|uniref:Circumsporozoite protein n=1 Tax=Seminavis robusta TaxID=568900 RepID=A0A9N8DWC8_9STRA|nr:Nidogen-like [Seminavis robusta]|eukprot:Sro402_g135380.1 Nidogen-like (2190) ;mRNA; f:5526-13336